MAYEPRVPVQQHPQWCQPLWHGLVRWVGLCPPHSLPVGYLFFTVTAPGGASQQTLVIRITCSNSSNDSKGSTPICVQLLSPVYSATIEEIQDTVTPTKHTRALAEPRHAEVFASKEEALSSDKTKPRPLLHYVDGLVYLDIDCNSLFAPSIGHFDILPTTTYRLTLWGPSYTKLTRVSAHSAQWISGAVQRSLETGTIMLSIHPITNHPTFGPQLVVPKSVHDFRQLGVPLTCLHMPVEPSHQQPVVPSAVVASSASATSTVVNTTPSTPSTVATNLDEEAATWLMQLAQPEELWVSENEEEEDQPMAVPEKAPEGRAAKRVLLAPRRKVPKYTWPYGMRVIIRSARGRFQYLNDTYGTVMPDSGHGFISVELDNDGRLYKFRSSELQPVI